MADTRLAREHFSEEIVETISPKRRQGSRVKTTSSRQFPRPMGRLLFAATLASGLAGGVAFYRHPSATGGTHVQEIT
jgi:hypothetical protein